MLKRSMSTLTMAMMATVAVAQTTPNAGETGATRPASGSTASAASAVAKPGSATGASTLAAKPDRPIPEQPLRVKLRNANTINPNYNREKDRGRGTKREYTPRRTASGERPDTMNQRRPGDPEPN